MKYLIYGFGGIFIALIASVFIFNAVDDSLDYDSFKHISSYEEFPQMPEETYVIYWYGENCGYCTQIKVDVLEFADSNQADLKVYLSESSSTAGSPSSVLDPFDGITLTGTPTMIFVRNNVVIDLQVGSDKVLLMMEQINNGTYPFLAN
ncbi:MAG: hypothetical protein K9L74_01340 [Candidatus Izimaplasma sp.]|nr:hypothetical protein [Candidatus Izimaplasma bacterium]